MSPNDFSPVLQLTQLPVLHIHMNVTQHNMHHLLVFHSLSAHNNNPYRGVFSSVNIYKHSCFTDAGTEASRSVLPTPRLELGGEADAKPCSTA